MPKDFEELKRELLQTDDEYRQLATLHHDLDERIHDLTTRNFLSEPEQVEEVRLKKHKLASERSDGEHPASSHRGRRRRRTPRGIERGRHPIPVHEGQRRRAPSRDRPLVPAMSATSGHPFT